MPRSTRILFAWEWGTGAGHLLRFKPIAADLIRRGHHVTLAVRDLTLARRIFPYAQPWVSALSLRQCPTLIEAPINRRSRPTTFAELAWNLGYGDRDRVLACLEAWRGLLLDSRPTVLVSDFGIGAVIAARSIGLPAIRLGTGFECPPPESPLAPLKLPYSGDQSHAHEAISTVRTNVDDAIQQLTGRDETGVYRDSIEQTPQILTTVPELEHYAIKRPVSDYVGGWSNDISFSNSLVPETSTESRLCFAYLKRSPLVVPLLAELARSGFQTLLAGPAVNVPMEDTAAEKHIIRCDGMIHLSSLAPRLSLGVTNANHGTTLSLLGHGVPILAIPLFIEQVVTAHNLARLGLGVMVMGDKSDSIAELVERVLAESYRSCCVEFASRRRVLLSSAANSTIERLTCWMNGVK